VRGADPVASPGFLLWRATLRWQREIALALQPLGLTHVQFVLLTGVLWFHDQRLRPSQRELADHVGTDVMMTSQVVRVLAAKGLIERTVDDRDARRKVLTATPDGRTLAERAMRVVGAADEGYFSSVPDRGALIAVLARLAAVPAPPVRTLR
jgi:DNA-binding MarR family transcriptional regulator